MIKIKNLRSILGNFSLKNINLKIEKNSFCVIMGPSGAGKSILLEIIAGIIPLKNGKILINNKDITNLPPEQREISIIYQDYALFPHLTVEENIDYGLRYHKISKKETDKIKQELTNELNIIHLLNRKPKNLSGGELQRVALIRALVTKPKVLLLDEPMSSLDPLLRQGIRDILKRLHKSTDTTFIMISHDFTDSLTLADTVIMFNNGEIAQTGSVEEIYRRPANRFVANFVGMKNLFPATFIDNVAKLDIINPQPNTIKNTTINKVPNGELNENITINVTNIPNNNQGFIAIRPEYIVLSKDTLSSSMRNSFKGEITNIINQGYFYEIHIDVKQNIFVAVISQGSLFEMDIKKGSSIYISFKATAVHTF